jgi:hypothetical protein
VRKSVLKPAIKKRPSLGPLAESSLSLSYRVTKMMASNVLSFI